MDFKIITNPLDQFEVRDFISLDAPILFDTHLAITNIGLYLTIATIIAIIFNVITLNKKIIFSN
jgi:F-type H+-transporting ATPase subunit a